MKTGTQSLVELERHNRRKHRRAAVMATTARKTRMYWMGAEPLNGLYDLRAFSLLNLGPHSETTGAVDTANQPSAPGLEVR